MGTRLSKAYMLTKVLTASKQEVVVYLYEGAIGFLHRATSAMRDGDRAASGVSLERTINILIELSGSLNYSANARLALKLDALYTYLIHALSLAGGKGDVAALEACEGILSILYDAWQQAASIDQETSDVKPARQLQISA